MLFTQIAHGTAGEINSHREFPIDSRAMLAANEIAHDMTRISEASISIHRFDRIVSDASISWQGCKNLVF